MTYDVYRYIFLGGAGLAALCLILSIVLFFVLRIPSVIGDLTGSTAKKAIESIRSQNEQSGDKTYKSSYVNRQRGKVTDRITDTGSIIPASTDDSGGAMATTKISTTLLQREAKESYVSTLADEPAGETTVLDLSTNSETTVLDSQQANSGTTMLCQEGAVDFSVEYNLVLIHTDEVI